LVARSVRDAEVAGSNPAVPTIIDRLTAMHLAEFQDLMRRTYLERDRQRGIDGTFRRLVEEVGELARSLRHDDRRSRHDELSDVLAWLVSLANQAGVDMEAAASRYARGCPKCGRIPCACPQTP
jgi:NTP pyrophosphatase (non-canonical NTP hydrolase)